ncbi:hypothetical protein F5X99DRAFT_406352 [Biscogniauxia marginata]|nr:hypothetical protein F5X99DRAFT_406352 [Biscogniauxia marginata]
MISAKLSNSLKYVPIDGKNRLLNLHLQQRDLAPLAVPPSGARASPPATFTIATVKTVATGNVTSGAAVTRLSSGNGNTGTVNVPGVHVAQQSSDSKKVVNRPLAAGVSILLLVVGAYLFWRRRRSRREQLQRIDGGGENK